MEAVGDGDGGGCSEARGTSRISSHPIPSQPSQYHSSTCAIISSVLFSSHLFLNNCQGHEGFQASNKVPRHALQDLAMKNEEILGRAEEDDDNDDSQPARQTVNVRSGGRQTTEAGKYIRYDMICDQQSCSCTSCESCPLYFHHLTVHHRSFIVRRVESPSRSRRMRDCVSAAARVRICAFISFAERDEGVNEWTDGCGWT